MRGSILTAVSALVVFSGFSQERLDPTGGYVRSDSNVKREQLFAVDLENSSNYNYEISGTSSVNMKFKPKSSGTAGSFVTRNEAANPNTEIAYSRLAEMMGVDQLFRIAVPYKLKSVGVSIFQDLIENGLSNGKIHGKMRVDNAHNILGKMNSNPSSLLGCLKEKSGDTYAADVLANGTTPNSRHPLFADLQAKYPKPTNGNYNLGNGYWTDRAKGAREYSILFTFDVIFGQWDRYSGGNITYKIVDGTKEVKLFSTDNGGADYWGNSVSWGQKQAGWFSRYDQTLINNLRVLDRFLSGEMKSLTVAAFGKTYSDPRELMVDMGLYSELTPDQYLRAFTRHLQLLLNKVDENVDSYGEEAVFF